MQPSKAIRRADRFHFGFCNACERYACGQSAEQIRATPTADLQGYVNQDDANAVTAGVHAALAAIVDGEIDAAMYTALEFGLSPASRIGLRELALDA